NRAAERAGDTGAANLDLSLDTDQLGRLTSTPRVVELSRYVHIDEAALAALAPRLARRIAAPGSGPSYPFRDGSEKTANWLLVLDALNFSFWGEPRWRVEYRGELLNGYTALAAALTRAVEEGVPITDASYLATAAPADLAQVLRGEGAIPMLD